jgi:hypothetical protein
MSLESIFIKLNFIKILSTPNEKSHLQEMHLDYSPQQHDGELLEDTFRTYFDEARKLGCCHLSVLHMPNGGHFTYLECDFLSGAVKHCEDRSRPQFFTKSSIYFQTYSFFNVLKYFISIIYLETIAYKMGGLTIKTVSCVIKTLILKPNSTLISGNAFHPRIWPTMIPIITK